MIAAGLAPPFPEGVIAVLWAIGALAAVAASMWGLFSWLLARIDERFRSAIRSEDFARWIDDRIVRAFEGAVSPFLRSQHDLADRCAVLERALDAEHRRLDDLLADQDDMRARLAALESGQRPP